MKQPLSIPETDAHSATAHNATASAAAQPSPPPAPAGVAVALLTGGIDRPYTFGLAMELASKGAALDIIGSDTLDFPEFHTHPGIRFLNLQGSQRPDVSFLQKLSRLARYYLRLFAYALRARPRIFHILWNNKFEIFDRTLLTAFYKLLGKKIVLTVHNVNAAKRDAADSRLNRLTLRIQYHMADHIFVHTDTARRELLDDFAVPPDRVTVIPFGVNNAVPTTSLSPLQAKQRLGIAPRQKTLLFFGRITPYKGLEYLAAAFEQVLARDSGYCLIVAGRPENDAQSYWSAIHAQLRVHAQNGRALLRADHIPDEDTELYFKAADVLVLPYKHIYQSGILFLGYSFGLPILVADLGSLRDEVVEGETGFLFKSEDAADLASTIERFFSSGLFANLDSRRPLIRDWVAERHSWGTVGRTTMRVYANLLRLPSSEGLPQPHPDAAKPSLGVRDRL